MGEFRLLGATPFHLKTASFAEARAADDGVELTIFVEASKCFPKSPPFESD